ncbi:MAG: hypothetical protein HYU87_06860, partial [Chloroflexi bacterium]|nr:hypothetical protein [Chloroflexota bacterium]
MSKAKAIIGLVVFAGGMIAGTLGAQIANPAPPESLWRALPPVEEPTAATDMTHFLLR